MQMFFNEAMKMEPENYLHTSLYQRTDLRTDHANGFSLDPASYGREIPEVPNAVPLSEVVTTIGRGIALGRGGAEDAPDNSPVRLVTVSDICDGRISDTLKSLPGDPAQYARYVVKDGDLIVGKVPTPFKAAVAEVPEGITLVASVNLYIVSAK